MPAIRFPATYPLPQSQAALLPDPDELAGFDPTSVSAGDPTPIPPSPATASAAQSANTVQLPPLNGNGRKPTRKLALPPGRNGASMPPPPDDAGEAAALQGAAGQSQAPPPEPPATLGQMDRSPATSEALNAPVNANSGPPAKPLTTAEQLASSQRPEAPHDNWGQRLGRAVLSLTRFAPMANQIIHPKWAEQMRDYQGQRADLEARLGEEKEQAGIDTEREKAGAYEAEKYAKAANYAETQDTRAASAKDRLEAAFEKTMGPNAVQLSPGEQPPEGFTVFKSPTNPNSVWVRRSPIVHAPKELLQYLPGIKEGQSITQQELDGAFKAAQAVNLENVRSGNKPDPKLDPNRWVADSNDPDPKISGPAKANLRALAQLKQSERPIINNNVPGSTDAPNSMAQAIAEYQQQFPTVRTTSPQAMAQADALMKQVKAVNPDYHQEYYNTFQKTENDATTGKLATSSNSFNTMIGHLTLLKNAADALHNRNIQVLNNIANQWGIQTGQDPATIFQTIVHRIGPETARAYIGAGGDASDRQKMEEDFSKNASPDQIHNAIRTAALLGKGKMDENINQYQRGTYGRGKQQLMSKEATESLQHLIGSSANGVVVKVKGKGPVTFPNQAAADGFRKEHADKVDK